MDLVATSDYSGKKPSQSTMTRIVGRYELEEMVGAGGMGVVWRARDIKTGSSVAIKIMKDMSDPAAVELFAKEWRALAEMCHPNIVDVRDVDVYEENKVKMPFFVMPLLRGATLAELIADGSSRLTETRIVEIITQACRGLQAAHQRGLIHRDIKPSNIFVMDDDTAKIIDFGVVYLAGSHSVTGQKGTVQYMSPEQVQMKEITPASDIFALGVVMYEALTRRKPFACATVEETMQAVLKLIPPSVSEINPSIQTSIGKVVHKCLAKQPMHRFSSARELSETLQKAYRNEPIFDRAKIQPRIERAKASLKGGDEIFASEVLAELESEGNLDPEITVLRGQIDLAMKQKKIRQLLESARARIEQDEIPLGLDKIREVLELDPENAEALKIRSQTEKQRNEAQVGQWLALSQTHLENRDFSAARHAVQEVLIRRSGDTGALDLLEKIDTVEADAKRVREQKEQLYGTAMRAYQNGEIDSALTKLGRLFAVGRSHPEAAIPERDAVYESFYKEVRSEHDSIRAVLEEAQHDFKEKNLVSALKLCTDHLARYPFDGAFQALKIQIEDAERQEVSAYIAAVSKSVEAEPDLDRRANLLREASERYPEEVQFAQQLKVMRERRDLVNSIVAKARQFDERGQYFEALTQWDILNNIHPNYPGLAFELEQCRKKRDRQATEEEKARFVEEIVGLMDSRAFTKAVERTRIALAEFPGDAELAGLQKLAETGSERLRESRQKFEEGQKAAADEDWTRATSLLRDAVQMDPRNGGMRDAVISSLTERARSIVDVDLPGAEALHREAASLDEEHRSVRALQGSIREARRQTFVGECLTAAREFVAAGDLQAAYNKIQEGRREYPKDARLDQFEALLVKNNNDRRLKEERAKAWVQLEEARKALEQSPDSAKIRESLKLSQTVRSQHPDDAEMGQMVAEIEQTVRRITKQEDLTQVLGGAPVAAAAVLPISTGRSGSRSIADDEATRISEPLKAKPASVPSVDVAAKPQSPKTPRSPGKMLYWALGSAAFLMSLTIGLILFFHSRSQRSDVAPVTTAKPGATRVHLTVEPSDSSIRTSGGPVKDGLISVPAGSTVSVEISRPGYRTRVLAAGAKGAEHVVLEPEPIRISVQNAEKSGTVELDGAKIGSLVDGSMDGEFVPDGKSHKLSATAGGRRLWTIEVQTTPGERPRLGPVSAKDVFAISTLGSAGTIYGGEQLKTVETGGRHLPIASSGTELPQITDQQHELTYGEGSSLGSISLDATTWPTLMVRSLAAEPKLQITSNVDSATLTVNGAPIERRRRGWQMSAKPGAYQFVLAAEGYEPQSWTMVVKRPQGMVKNVVLIPKKVEVATTSALVIAGGTPGAEVELDGRKVGDLDERGAGQFARVLSAGQHTVTMRKAGVCGSKTVPMEIRPPAEGRVNDARLDPCGSISIQAGGKSATVTAKRVGTSQPIELSLTSKVQVEPGQYDITAEAPGTVAFTTQVLVEAGQNREVVVKLDPTQSCGLQDPGQATTDGEFMKTKNSGNLVYLKTGCTNVNLSFAQPKGGIKLFGGKRKVQWDIETPDGKARVQYELDDQKLTRKVIENRDTTGQKESPAPAGTAGQAVWSVRLKVEGSHVTVSGEKGETLDDFVSSLPDLASGRVGIKTNAPFKVKSRY